MSKLKALYLLNPDAYARIYGPEERRDLADLVDVYAPLQTVDSVAENPAVLVPAQVILSGWGMATLDGEFLAHAPNLQGVFYGAGSIKRLVTDAFWARNLPIVSAWSANAVPVIEFTLAEILFSLKQGWYYVRQGWEHQAPVPRTPVPGAYGSVVGLISLGMIGQGVARLLQQFDVQVMAYDPFVSPATAAKLGVRLASLDEIFAQADVVSLHTPWLPETEGLITGAHFARMKENATFINTARGAIVREEEMIDVLQNRPDLFAVLDVTYPEPPVSGSPLYTLPNVVRTPHIAGSLDNECRRMGRLVVEEVGRFVRHEPLQWAVSRERAATLA